MASSSFFLVVGCKAIALPWFEVDPSFHVVGFAFDGFVLKSRDHFTHQAYREELRPKNHHYDS